MSELTEMQQWMAKYDAYLRIERQLSAVTRQNYQRQLNEIHKLFTQNGILTWQDVTPSLIRYMLAEGKKAKLENMFSNMAEGDVAELNVIVKADVQGSVEAIVQALQELSTDEVKVKVVGSGVGGITETDATLAAASNAIILGFNVRADATARRVIEAESIDLRYYSIIYELLNEIKAAMSGMLAPEFKQEIIGLAEVRDVFRHPKFGAIAGCMVTEGVVKRNNPIRVLRDNVVIFEGELESLRRFKDDVSEVRNGMECGIGVKNYNDVKVGDQIEVFEVVEVKRSI